MTIAVGAHVGAFTNNFFSTLSTAPTTTQVAGSTFVVSIGWYNNTSTPVVTDSNLNTYTQIGATVIGGADPKFRGALFYCQNGVGAAGSVYTVTFTGTTDVMTMFLVEVTGGLTSGILDQAPAGIEDTSSPYTSNITGTTAQANELLLAFDWTYTNSSPETLTWGNGFTALNAQPDHFTGGSASRIVSATGTYQSSMTSAGGATTSAIALLATFKSLDTTPMPGLFFGAGTTS